MPAVLSILVTLQSYSNATAVYLREAIATNTCTAKLVNNLIFKIKFKIIFLNIIFQKKICFFKIKRYTYSRCR